MDFIKGEILSVLPTLTEPLLQAVVDKLAESGVEGVDDFEFVEASDLDLLKPIQSRKLLHVWKSRGEFVLKHSECK